MPIKTVPTQEETRALVQQAIDELYATGVPVTSELETEIRRPPRPFIGGIPRGESGEPVLAESGGPGWGRTLAETTIPFFGQIEGTKDIRSPETLMEAIPWALMGMLGTGGKAEQELARRLAVSKHFNLMGSAIKPYEFVGDPTKWSGAIQRGMGAEGSEAGVINSLVQRITSQAEDVPALTMRKAGEVAERGSKLIVKTSPLGVTKRVPQKEKGDLVKNAIDNLRELHEGGPVTAKDIDNELEYLVMNQPKMTLDKVDEVASWLKGKLERAGMLQQEPGVGSIAGPKLQKIAPREGTVVKGATSKGGVTPVHGTDIQDVEGILENGLKPGSAIDFTKDHSWAGEYPVTIEVPGASKAMSIYVPHNNYYTTSETLKSTKVTIDLDQYTSQGVDKALGIIDKIKAKYPDVKIITKGKADVDPNSLTLSNMSKFLEKEYDLPPADAMEMAKIDYENWLSTSSKERYKDFKDIPTYKAYMKRMEEYGKEMELKKAAGALSMTGEVKAEEPEIPLNKIREPSPSEIEYFKKNPHVSGMATEDDRVIINPFSNLSGKEKKAVAVNEHARLFMRKGLKPDFELTPEQIIKFKEYSQNLNDIRETVAARILSGDPSVGNTTPEQRAFVEKLKSAMKVSNEP